MGGGGSSGAIVCIWRATVEGPSGRRRYAEELHRLRLDAKHDVRNSKHNMQGTTSGVAALSFSPDAELLMTVSQSMHHTVTVWDWSKGEALCSARSHASPVYLCRFDPYQFHDDHSSKSSGIDEESKDIGRGRQRCYTAVTAGVRHAKVWVVRCGSNPGSRAATGTSKEGVSGFPSVQRGQWRPSTHAEKQEPPRFINTIASAEAEAGRKHGTARVKRGAWLEELCGASSSAHLFADMPTTLCVCFLPDRKRAANASIIVTGTASGDVIVWSQRCEDGARVSVKRGKVGAQKTLPSFPGTRSPDLCTIFHARTGGASVAALAPLVDHITGGTQFLSGGADNNLILWGFTGPGDSSKGLGAPSQLLVVPLASPPVGIAIGSAFSKVTVATALTGILEVDVSEEADDVPPSLLLSAHRQRVAAVAAHPTVPVFVTCSQDATLRLWSMKERRVMTSAAIVAAGSAVCFSGAGSLVACGTVDGSIQVFGARSGYPPCLDLRGG